MKKYILSSVALLLSVAGMGADVKNLDDLSMSQAYLIHCADGYLYANGTETYISASANAADASYQWGICVTAYGERAIYNLATLTFLTADGTSCPLTATTTFVDLTPSGTEGAWYMSKGDYVMGLSTASSEVTFDPSLPTFSFEETSVTIPDRTSHGMLAKALLAHTNPRLKLTSRGTQITSLDALEDGMNVVLYQVNKSKYIYEDLSNSKMLLSSTLPTNNYASLNYVLRLHEVDDGWQIELPATGNFISGLEQSTAIYTGEIPLTFTIAAHETSSGAFTFLGNGTGQYLDDGVSWWDASGANTAYKMYIAEVAETEYYPIVYDNYCNGQSLGTTFAYTESNTYTAPVFDGYTELMHSPNVTTVAQGSVITVEYTNGTPSDLTMASSPVNDITTDTWYVMYNRGRKGSATDISNVVKNTNEMGLVGETEPMKYLVRLSNAGEGKYYIETGLGNYFQALSTTNSTAVTTGATKEKFTIAKINNTNGHFYVQGSNNVILDCNSVGGAVVSYGTSIPTGLNGNNDWAFYPVEYVARFVPTVTDIYTVNNLNVNRGALMSAPSQSTKWVWDSGKNSQTFDATDPNCQWIFVPTAVANQYCLYNVGKKKFIVPTQSGSYGDYSWMFSSDAVPLLLFLQSDGTYKLRSVSGSIYLSVSNSYIGPIINYNDEGAKFTLTKRGSASSAITSQLTAAMMATPPASKPMTLNAVGGKSYATLYLDYDAQTDANTKAYYITETENGYAKLTEVANDGHDIPAYTAVVLVNENGTTTPTFTTGFANSNGYAEAVAEATNLLKGTLVEKELDLSQSSPYYSLGVVDKIGFYKFDDGLGNANSTTITLGANKAYLEYDGSAGVKGFVLDFETGIESLSPNPYPVSEGSRIYDLSGRHVNTPSLGEGRGGLSRGVYIVGGRKVIVK